MTHSWSGGGGSESSTQGRITREDCCLDPLLKNYSLYIQRKYIPTASSTETLLNTYLQPSHRTPTVLESEPVLLQVRIIVGSREVSTCSAPWHRSVVGTPMVRFSHALHIMEES